MRPPDHWPEPPETSEEQAFREHREDLNRRLRAAYLAGAQERAIAEHGRGLTEEELAEVFAEYPGDLPTRLPGGSSR